MTERDQRIRLGLFVFAALIALATLIVLFGKRPTLWTSRDKFQVEFTNAPNLQPGTPVRRSGVKIGEVSSVELDPSGKVKVELAVDKRYPPRKNEVVSITQSLLSGDAMIDFVTDPKNKDVSEYTPKETAQTPIQGRSPLDPRAAAEGVKDLGQAAQQTLEQIRASIDQFTRVAPEVERTLKEYTLLSQTVRQAIPEIQQTNDSLRKLADLTRANIPTLIDTNDRAKVAIDNWNKAGERLNVLLMTNEQKFNRALDDLALLLARASKLLSEENQQAVTALIKNANQLFTEENVKNLNETLKNVRSSSANLDETMKDGPKTMKQLNDTLAKADVAIENFRKFSAPFADGAGDFHRNMAYTSAQLGLLIKDVRDLMKGYAGSDGTVQKLLTDPTLYNQMSSAIFSLSKLMPKLELILDDLKDFSDQIARHPNRLIFDRGGGLKGSPFAPTPGSRSTHGPVTTPPITIGPR